LRCFISVTASDRAQAVAGRDGDELSARRVGRIGLRRPGWRKKKPVAAEIMAKDSKRVKREHAWYTRGMKRVLVLAFLIVLCAFPQKKKPKTKEGSGPDLIVVKMEVRREQSMIVFDGVVRNGSGHAFKGIVLFFEFLDADDKLISRRSIEVTKLPVEPGEEGVVEAQTNSQARMVSYRLDAEDKDGRYLTLDKPGPLRLSEGLSAFPLRCLPVLALSWSSTTNIAFGRSFNPQLAEFLRPRAVSFREPCSGTWDEHFRTHVAKYGDRVLSGGRRGRKSTPSDTLARPQRTQSPLPCCVRSACRPCSSRRRRC
jgi:hypothetical protein